MRVVLKRAKHFITCGGKFYGAENETAVKTLLALEARGERYEQLSLFSEENALSIPSPSAAERGNGANERYSLLSTAANAESARTGQL